MKYEYYVVAVEGSTSELNRYLGQGWEVFKVTTQRMGGETSSRGYVFFTLRREKESK